MLQQQMPNLLLFQSRILLRSIWIGMKYEINFCSRLAAYFWSVSNLLYVRLDLNAFKMSATLWINTTIITFTVYTKYLQRNLLISVKMQNYPNPHVLEHLLRIERVIKLRMQMTSRSCHCFSQLIGQTAVVAVDTHTRMLTVAMQPWTQTPSAGPREAAVLHQHLKTLSWWNW